MLPVAPWSAGVLDAFELVEDSALGLAGWEYDGAVEVLPALVPVLEVAL